MNRIISRSATVTRAFAGVLLMFGTSVASFADTVAYWNFNSLSIATASAPGTGGVPTNIAVNQGSGSLSLTGFLGNVDDFAGSTINVQGTDVAGPSLSLVAGGAAAPFPGNGSHIEMQLNLADYADPVITFATRGTASGFNTGTWSYSVAGGPFTTVSGVNTATTSTTFALATVNLSAVNAIDNQANVRLRYTLSGATNATGNNRIDNLLVSATATSDSTPPILSSLAPADNATGVPITATPTITLNEAVKKGATGSIVLRRTSDNSVLETIAITSAQITVSGTALTITPAVQFANSTGYYIEIPAGAIEDLAGNDYAGLSGPAAWNLTTIAASVLPSVTKTFATQTRVTQSGSSATADYYGQGSGQGTFAVYGFGTFNFSKLDFNLSGASQITGLTEVTFKLRQNFRTFTTGTQLEFFLTTDSSAGKAFNLTVPNGIDPTQYNFAPVSLGQFTYTPTSVDPTFEIFTLNVTGLAASTLLARLNTGENFSIILAAVNVPDAITFAGKNNTFDPFDPELKITVTETTGTDTTPPVVAFLTPADGAGGLPVSSNLRINFNELVQKGAGTITILRASDNSVFEAIDVTGANVTVNLGTVTIDPVAALDSAASYYVQVTAGAIRDVSGNDFAGISDATTWNFSTAQPPITNLGPFSISRFATAGTVVGVLNPAVLGKEGIRYAMLGGSGGSTMMKGEPGTGYVVHPIFTIGDTFENATGALNPTSAGNFSPVGTPDGIGAYSLNGTTVRAFVNHEVEIPNTGAGGYPFSLANGTILSKGGARITYFDIDKATRRVVDTGLAIARMYDRSGNVVVSANQLELGGLDRMCSSSLFEPNLFGAGRGLVDRIYITGEETSTSFGHPHGGTFWALDTATGDFWALPDMGRGSWENAALVDTGTTTHVAFLMGDDAPGTPLYLYVGEKNAAPTANFVERNGLKGGQLYVWRASNGNTTPQQFNGTGATRAGTWLAINARNAGAAGTAGHDALGYKNDTTLQAEADALGAFSFSRPEDLSTSPTDGTIVAFTSTGRGSLYPADNWGDTYILDIDFAGSVPTSGALRILYDGDDAGGGQFLTPEEGLRSPDNLDWSDDGFLYVQEDQANQSGNFGAAGRETSIWRLNPSTGAAVRVAETDRATVLPLGSTDGETGDFGNWESSGIVDVSTLFGESAGTLFLFDLQAHSVRNGLIASKQLYEGGQLCFLERGFDRGAFKVNPNSGVITLANPAALRANSQSSHTLRFQAFDGTNHTLRVATVNVTNTSVTTTNSFKAAAYNISHFRASSGALIADLAGTGTTQSQQIARVIQRNNPDVLLLNEFDYDAKGVAVRRFQENYLEVGQNGEAPVYYPYAFIAPSNTGVPSGFDLDNNGTAVTTPGAPGYGEDAFGFGTFPGQYAFVVLSKFPIDTANVRTFQKFRWKDMPGALLPDNANIAGPGDWYSPAELEVFRLSSKNHADVPVLVNGTRVHILASHPTPPVFDNPGSGLPWIAGVDHNGRRNSDEIRFWSDYVNPALSSYIYDDSETPATASGGLPVNSRFILMGDQNADQDEGDSTDPAIKQITGGGIYAPNILFNTTFVPGGGSGPQPDDTAGFSGGVRVDYALPSAFGLAVNSGAVFWPPSGDPLAGAAAASDHHMVYVSLSLTGVDLPPSTDLLTYYAPAQGLAGVPLMNALHNIIDDHVVIDYGLIDDLMRVIDESPSDSTRLRLLYSLATLPKTSTQWNREHVWPRSDGVGDQGPDYSDLHHLFPAKDTVNSLRSNLPFDESANVQSDPFAPESFRDNDSWEPVDRDKGIVARAHLYMMTRYDGSDPLTTNLLLADNTAPIGTQGVLTTLLAWHRAFPPTDYERARNNAIYSGITSGGTIYAQGNRNPFIDFPQFADAMFLGAGTTSFGKWQWQKFTLAQLIDPTISGIDADADGDGLSTYAEFLLNGNPLVGDDAPLTVSRSENVISIVFERPKGLFPQRTYVETSETLATGTWSRVTNWEASATAVDIGDYERITYTATIDFPSDPRRFWRVVFE